MRDGCWQCVLKHLGQAAVLAMEIPFGYPEHKYLVFGHLAEAAEECYEFHPKLANVIRAHRLAYMEDSEYVVPYLSLASFADLCQNAPEDQLPGFPEDQLPGFPEDLISPN